MRDNMPSFCNAGYKKTFCFRQKKAEEIVINFDTEKQSIILQRYFFKSDFLKSGISRRFCKKKEKNSPVFKKLS